MSLCRAASHPNHLLRCRMRPREDPLHRAGSGMDRLRERADIVSTKPSLLCRKKSQMMEASQLLACHANALSNEPLRFIDKMSEHGRWYSDCAGASPVGSQEGFQQGPDLFCFKEQPATVAKTIVTTQED